MTQAAKQVYETLLNEGAMNTLDLRKAAKLSNAKDSEFNKALEYLQSDFKILPIGVSEAGAWKYSFIYEIVPRHYPDCPNRRAGSGKAKRAPNSWNCTSSPSARRRNGTRSNCSGGKGNS
jgi:hypothetical protein